MIAYLVTKRHRYTIEKYLNGWAPSLRDLIRVMPYEHLDRTNGHEPATYIFSDIERLFGSRMRAAVQAHRSVSLLPGSAVLNDPSRSLMRYELLRTLREQGINDFSVYRLTETREPQRFPVFLREEDKHRTLTPLLRDHQELDKAIAGVFVRRRGLDRILMVEFYDTSDGHGVFRKYAALRVGSRIIPKHVFISADWEIKQSDLVDTDRLREEESYLQANPHEDEVRSMFEIAGITYGRIDYSMSNGRIQVWEINTNPMIFAPSDRVKTSRLAFKQKTNREVVRAFEALDDYKARSPVRVSETSPARARVGVPAAVRIAGKTARRLRRTLGDCVEKIARLFWRPVIAWLIRRKWS